MKTTDFINTIDHWLDELQGYSFDQLIQKPQPDKWSLGQVCMHLIDATGFFLSQVDLCLHSDKHSDEDMTPRAKEIFASNEFPDKMLEGPPSNAKTPQPISKDEIINGFNLLKKRIISLNNSNTRGKGKTKHPGHMYFNAAEWLKYAHMHFRHHERQKKRIDQFLGSI